jgi:hypothetical protein
MPPRPLQMVFAGAVSAAKAGFIPAQPAKAPGWRCSLFWLAMPETRDVAVHPEPSGTLAVAPAQWRDVDASAMRVKTSRRI